MPRTEATGLLATTAAAVLAAACAAGPTPTVHVTATPLPSPTSSVSPTPSPSPTPAQSPTVVDRPPTDADRARFATSHRPEGASEIRHVAVDVDGDGVDELVFAMIRDSEVRVEVAWWQGRQYAIEAAADGAEATHIERIQAQDVNANGSTEVAVQHSRDSGAGLDLWTVDDRDLEEVDSEGGCADGNSFGDRGARLVDLDGDDVLEVVGTCDGLLGVFGADVTWRWDGEAYVAEDTNPGRGRDDD